MWLARLFSWGLLTRFLRCDVVCWYINALTCGRPSPECLSKGKNSFLIFCVRVLLVCQSVTCLVSLFVCLCSLFDASIRLTGGKDDGERGHPNVFITPMFSSPLPPLFFKPCKGVAFPSASLLRRLKGIPGRIKRGALQVQARRVCFIPFRRTPR